MRDQLIQYVNLLFAGASDCEEIKQEILQNTLDRYDDLIAEGKVPEAAYRLAITGIGDINEILGTTAPPVPAYSPTAPQPQPEPRDSWFKKCLRAAAVFLYIISIIPLIVLSEMGMDIFGFCGTLAIVAVATVLIMLGSRKEPKQPKSQETTPERQQQKSISSAVWAVGVALYFFVSFVSGRWEVTWIIFPITGAAQNLIEAALSSREQPVTVSSAAVPKAVTSTVWLVGVTVYFILSFATHAWYITWILFPITAAVKALVKAIFDLKEVMKHEE